MQEWRWQNKSHLMFRRRKCGSGARWADLV
jgi:hypothetical protein